MMSSALGRPPTWICAWAATPSLHLAFTWRELYTALRSTQSYERISMVSIAVEMTLKLS